MHTVEFIQDLAIIMLIAGVVTVLFHRLKQPVVLGYIVAGLIIGPYTPPFAFISDEKTIKILAELGVVFLMFSLGLDFSLRKLARVGATALIAALFEIVMMIWIGYEIGRFFDWSSLNSLFLGSILAISSTTIIVKALDELGMKQEPFAHLIFGILIVEDIIAIAIIALLSAVATTGSMSAGSVVTTVGKLSVFLIVGFVSGMLLVPRLLSYVANFRKQEMLLITVLGISFGFCLLALKLHYSVALGAFMIGTIMAESNQLRTIERLIEPIKDMFSAIFFVSVGLLLDPRMLTTYAVPIIVITFAVLVGKVVTCSLGTFIAGHDGRTSMRVGMGLAQIGEFSFIIASLGLSLNVTSDFLFPVAVAVSVITTLLTPYLIKLADPLSTKLEALMPGSLIRVFGLYTIWLQNIQLQTGQTTLGNVIRRSVLQVLINFALIVSIFLAGAYFGGIVSSELTGLISEKRIQNSLVWGATLLVSLPFLIAAYRKMQALSMLLAELTVKPAVAGQYTEKVRRVISEVIPIASIVGMFFLVIALSASILPPPDLLILVLILAAGLVLILWRWFVRLHSKLQATLIETFKKGGKNRKKRRRLAHNQP